MTLSERLMKITEEKTRLECDNQKLRENCIAWQKAYNDKDASFKLMFEAWEKADTEKTRLREENSELTAWKSLTDILFKRCGTFIYNNRKSLGVNDYLINELGLNNIVIECQQPKNETKQDDILDLFKQSSK